MPIYDYECRNGHLVEARRGYADDAIPCPLCGDQALRQAVYVSQSLVTETGVRSGRRNPVPRDERRYDLSLFKEATAERDYAYSKVENETGQPVPAPSLWREAKQRATTVTTGAAPPPKGTA